MLAITGAVATVSVQSRPTATAAEEAAEEATVEQEEAKRRSFVGQMPSLESVCTVGSTVCGNLFRSLRSSCSHTGASASSVVVAACQSRPLEDALGIDWGG